MAKGNKEKKESQREKLEFSSLRSDWYSSNQTLPRAIRQSLEGKRSYEFIGFPRQWIPVFEWFGVSWHNSITPGEYTPFFSDLSETDIVAIVERAKAENSLRILVESASMYDPIVSDLLYIVDNTASTLSAPMQNEIREVNKRAEHTKKRPLLLNGWQSYGRPSLKLLEERVSKVMPKSTIAAVLPCALTRPYDRSRTHKRIYFLLKERCYQPRDLHRIVITSLGVLPEEVWSMPQVLAYDAGVPDIYRILRLARAFFGRADYELVIDCLQFEPYADILRILKCEGIIREIAKIKVPGRKPFHIRR